jgi:hypothetical protein
MPPPEEIAQALGYGVALPALVAAVVIIALARFSRLPGRVVGAIAFLAGFLTGWAVLQIADRPLFEFKDEWQWLPVWISAAVIVDPIDLAFGRKRRVGGILRLVASAAVIYAAGEFLISATPARTPGDAPADEIRIYTLNTFRLIAFVSWLLFPPGVKGFWPTTQLAMCIMTAGMILVLSEINIYAQIAGLVGGVVFGSAVTAAWRPDADFPHGMIPGVCVALTALMMNGYLDSMTPIPLACYALVTFGPLALLVGSAPPIRRLPVFQRFSIVTLGLILPLATAVALALRAE